MGEGGFYLVKGTLQLTKENLARFFIDMKMNSIYNVYMNEIYFDWDESKNRTNIKKHKVSFEEAKTVFFDPNARIINDPDHSQKEDRFVILGISRKLRLLVVCHCYRNADGLIRIISARKAMPKERKFYGD